MTLDHFMRCESLFAEPRVDEIVRLERKATVFHRRHGWMSIKQASKEVERWKNHAIGQNQPGSPNHDKVVLSFFDRTGAWSQPWEDAGYQVYRFDIQTDAEVGDVNNFGAGFFGDIFGDFEGLDIYAILAACPCTDFAVSGARHFAAKDADGRTEQSIELVHQTLRAIEYFRPTVWAIENPVGRIETLAGLPRWRLSFDPCNLGDPYTKRTLIWGRFNADLPVAPVEPTEGSKMHTQYGGRSLATKNARSVTPVGFAYGFFVANNAEDHPVMALTNKYERVCPKLIGAAFEAGFGPQELCELIDDPYYMDLDYEGVETLLRTQLTLRNVSLNSFEDANGQMAMWL